MLQSLVKEKDLSNKVIYESAVNLIQLIEEDSSSCGGSLRVRGKVLHGDLGYFVEFLEEIIDAFKE